MNIVKNIKRLRLLNNMRQKDLAEILSVSPQAISKWESGKNMPDISVLPQIADNFGVSMDELFDYKKKS